MVKSAFTRWLWDVKGMTTTLLKVKILKFPQTKLTQIHAFFKKSNTFTSNASWNWRKIKQKLSNTLRQNFCYLKIILFVHPRYHSKIIGDIIKNCAKIKYISLNEGIWYMTLKMRLKMTNRPRPRQVHKHTAYKICLSIMMVISIKQHLSNIWGSIHEKVMQHWGWVERKSLAYKKTCITKKCSLFQCKISHTQYLAQQQQLPNSRHCGKAINISVLFFVSRSCVRWHIYFDFNPFCLLVL